MKLFLTLLHAKIILNIVSFPIAKTFAPMLEMQSGRAKIPKEHYNRKYDECADTFQGKFRSELYISC